MSTFIIYLLEASICLAMFYSVYIVFKGDTFYTLKRVYLVFTVLLSILIPQVSLPDLLNDVEQLVVVEPVRDLSELTYHDNFEKVVFGQIPETILVSENKFFLSFSNLIGIIYMIGVLFFVYRLLRNLFHIYRLYKNNKKERYLNYSVILLPKEYPTFSFFNSIFLNKKNLSDIDENEVILHEIVHIKQKHSYDILFCEVCRIVFWFNPIIWLYKSSIVKVHECLADQYFVKTKPENIKNYQSLLLKQYLSKIQIELAHPFNYSLIKYRIKMMTKDKSKWWAKYKLGFALPVIVIGLVAFSNADLVTPSDNSFFSDKDVTREPEPENMVFIPMGQFDHTEVFEEDTITIIGYSIDAFWMSNEVSVGEYKVFLQSLQNEPDKTLYKKALPDEAVLKNMDRKHKGYLTTDKYDSLPIVGISYLQSIEYCNWLTNRENAKLKSKGLQPISPYRLPTSLEWDYASLKWEYNGFEKESRGKLQNTQKGNSNRWGLYHMFDNVDELTDSPYYKNRSSANDLKLSDYDPNEIGADNVVLKKSNARDFISVAQASEIVGFRYVRTYKGTQ